MIGENKTGLFGRIAAHHTADGIGDKFLYRIFQQPGFGFLGKRKSLGRSFIRFVIVDRLDFDTLFLGKNKVIAHDIEIFYVFAIPIPWVVGERDFVPRDFGGKLVLQTVSVDENTIVLNFKPPHLLGLPLPIAPQCNIYDG